MARTQGSHSGITGPKVREAALKLFARHGFAAVSMRQIAGEVGVQAGALYNYTPDKQTLLFDLMKTHLEDLLAAQEEAQAGQPEPFAALRDFTRFHINFHTERPEEVFIAYMELRNLSDENFEVIEKLRRAYEGRLVDILKRGVDEGVFTIADTRVAAMALIAMLNGVNTWFREGGRLSLAEVQDIYWDMVRKAVSS
uniref:TetR/AcrR family transcriptional regulator n=1 Tax=Roseovarius indicus TaxID=540747 RepID=UPI003B522E9F